MRTKAIFAIYKMIQVSKTENEEIVEIRNEENEILTTSGPPGDPLSPQPKDNVYSGAMTDNYIGADGYPIESDPDIEIAFESERTPLSSNPPPPTPPSLSSDSPIPPTSPMQQPADQSPDQNK